MRLLFWVAMGAIAVSYLSGWHETPAEGSFLQTRAAGSHSVLARAEAAADVERDFTTAAEAATEAADTARPWMSSWGRFLPAPVIVVVVCLLGLSAFFSSCETAFLSISKPRLRVMREESGITSRLVVQMVDTPGRLLTTILVGNMLVNTLIGVILGTRVKDFFEYGVGLPPAAAYLTAILGTTATLLFFGEVTPKVFAVRAKETYARAAVIPLLAADRVLAPFRKALLRFTDALFRVTRFHTLRAAPYITDEEIKSVLSSERNGGTVEEEGRAMIRRILEFRETQVREILVPRLDTVAVPEEATVAEALDLYRTHEYSRMPVYREDMDHITGILFAKDLLPSVTQGNMQLPVKTLARPPHFVPETMSVQDFIESVRRLRSHLAVVVDEYGGTEGIVTLHDAIELVVGDIQDDDEEEPSPLEKVGERTYRVRGNCPLDELEAGLGVEFNDTEHQTVTGFLMDQAEKLLSAGDQVRFGGLLFTVEAVEGKRASRVRIELAEPEEDAP